MNIRVKKQLKFKNNSEKPVDALAEKHQLLTDNLESRDATHLKSSHFLFLFLNNPIIFYSAAEQI